MYYQPFGGFGGSPQKGADRERTGQLYCSNASRHAAGISTAPPWLGSDPGMAR